MMGPLELFFSTRSPLVPLLLLLLFSLAALQLSQQSSTAGEQREQDFARWLPNHALSEGGLLLWDRRSLAEGEVLLFRTKKSRHRAIPVVMGQSAAGRRDGGEQQHKQNQPPLAAASRFSDALTFKDWLRRVYREDKALKVSVRTTEVVRPVLQHLYATRTHFQAPIIVHANTFAGAGPSRERPVDAVQFVDSVRALLPGAVISLGWTPSEDWAAVNRLDWAQAFQLLALLLHAGGDQRQQPVMLNMRMNDAVHSAEVLEWLLGVDRPTIFLVLRGDIGTDFVDAESPLRRLTRLGTATVRRRLLFDVDENWRTRIRRFAAGADPDQWQLEAEKHRLDQGKWRNWLFPSSLSPLSTSVLSPTGVAFLGWPNSLLLSTRLSAPFPARQSLSGRVMFLPKRQTREIVPQRRTGLLVYLFDTDPELLYAPRVPHSIQAFIGYDGRISLENNNAAAAGGGPTRTSGSDSNYPKSSSGQLPKWPCYAFRMQDKGWRVEMEVWTEKCSAANDDDWGEEEDEEQEDGQSENWVSQRTFLQLDTPVGKNRRSRHLAVGKSGDGAVDFLVRELEHNRSPPCRGAQSAAALVLVAFVSSALFLLPSLSLNFPVNPRQNHLF